MFWSVTISCINYKKCPERSGFIRASMSKIQGLLKASPTTFKDLKLMKNSDLRVKILLQKDNGDISTGTLT